MTNMNDMLISIGKKVPAPLLEKWQLKLIYAGITDKAEMWFAKRILLVPLFSLVFAMLLLNFFENAEIALVGFMFAVIALAFFSYLQVYFAIMERTAALEKALPDFLMLMVSNLRAGMTPFDAFVRSARPEFGPLYVEVIKAAGSVGGKRSLDNALTDLVKRFDSEIFRKTIELFLRATKAGGSIAKLLAGNAEEVRRIQDLRAELISATSQQSILLGFIIALLMPFLLAIGYNFLVVFTSIQEQISTLSGGERLSGIQFFGGEITIKPIEMFYISVGTLIATNFMVSLFMGVVRYGRPLYGLRYLPYILAISLFMFFVTQNLLIGFSSSFG